MGRARRPISVFLQAAFTLRRRYNLPAATTLDWCLSRPSLTSSARTPLHLLVGPRTCSGRAGPQQSRSGRRTRVTLFLGHRKLR